MSKKKLLKEISRLLPEDPFEKFGEKETSWKSLL